MNLKTSGFLVLVCSVVSSVPTSAQVEDTDQERCEALGDLRLVDTNLLSATLIPVTEALPQHCRVLGYVRPAINFEVVLPVDDWNGKLYVSGCGGFCGKLGNTNRGLKKHYATATMDSGHWGTWLFDGRWAYHNRVAEVDFGHRAVHETTRVAKELVAAFYGREPQKSYYVGCSNGGRMALMEAIKYPHDFDGIVCGAPAQDMTGLGGIFLPWLVQANTDANGKNIINASDLKSIHEAVLRACDASDRLADGMIEDPRYCRFDPETLERNSANPDGFLSKAQVQTLKKWYQGARDSAGKQLYPGGQTLGSEENWRLWCTGKTDAMEDDMPYLIARDFLRYMAFRDDPGESFDVADFDFDKDPPRLEYMADIYNATSHDLVEFQKSGGKLFIFHGWNDAGIPPWRTIEYVKSVEEHMGGREAVQQFVRLFLIPGMGHCGGPGYDFDPLSALETWVEQGEVPDTFRVTKKNEQGDVEWARDLYPYPMRTVYKGSGDPRDPSSYEGREP